MKRFSSPLPVGAACAILASSLTLAYGCGSSNDTSEAGTDAGLKSDHNAPDGGKEAGPNKDVAVAADAAESGAPEDAGPPVPSGAKQIVNTAKSGLVRVEAAGLTEDNQYVVYYSFSTTTVSVYAAPISGGAPIPLLPTPSNSYTAVRISHDAVFVWNQLTPDPKTNNYVGSLTSIWTPKNGLVSPNVKSSTAGLAAASPDSTLVVYTSNATSDGTSGDIIVQGSDLVTPSAKTLLATTGTSVEFGGPPVLTNFYPDIAFANTEYFVAAHEERPDSGSPTATVSFWDTATWTRTDLVTNAATYSGSSTPVLNGGLSWSSSTTGSGTGGVIVAATAAGALEAFTLPSTTPVPIDIGVSSFEVLPNGSGVLYGASDGAYREASLPSPTSITTILTTGYGAPIEDNDGPFAVSPDGNWSIFSTMTDGLISENLNLVQSAAASTSTSLLATATGQLTSDAFTADSKYATYLTSISAIGTAGYVGNLYASPVAGGAAITVSTNEVAEAQFLTASQIIYNDNFMLSPDGTLGYADISTVDVSATSLKPKLIMQQADQFFLLTSDRSTLVFGLSVGDSKTNGVYAYKL